VIGYLIVSWNPWDCVDVYKKVFLTMKEVNEYKGSYKYDRDEVLDVHEVEIG